MNFDYTGIGQSQSYINDVQKAAAQAPKKNSLTQEDFLKLLTTQLAQQDPTEPMDNNQMVATMSQLSVVENLTTINSGMQGIIDSVSSSSALSASTLVGRSVLVDAKNGFFDGKNPVYTKIDAGPGADNIKVTIKDKNGTVVSEYNAPSGSGGMQFAWDGVKSSTNGPDGKPVIEYFPAGEYKVEVTATQAGKEVSLPVKMYATVGSVTLGSTLDKTMLNLIGYGDVPLSKVEEVSL